MVAGVRTGPAAPARWLAAVLIGAAVSVLAGLLVLVGVAALDPNYVACVQARSAACPPPGANFLTSVVVVPTLCIAAGGMAALGALRAWRQHRR